MFTDFFEKRHVGAVLSSDYFDYIDGKPRYEGVRSFSALPPAPYPTAPQRPTNAETVCGLGNRKNEVFSAVLAEEGVIPIRVRRSCWTS